MSFKSYTYGRYLKNTKMRDASISCSSIFSKIGTKSASTNQNPESLFINRQIWLFALIYSKQSFPDENSDKMTTRNLVFKALCGIVAFQNWMKCKLTPLSISRISFWILASMHIRSVAFQTLRGSVAVIQVA